MESEAVEEGKNSGEVRRYWGDAGRSYGQSKVEKDLPLGTTLNHEVILIVILLPQQIGQNVIFFRRTDVTTL